MLAPEHRTIVAAIGAGDPEAAFRAGRTHVRHGRERFVGSLEQERDEPQGERAGAVAERDHHRG
jgi:DNA-binding FadR family transcriptional regulator